MMRRNSLIGRETLGRKGFSRNLVQGIKLTFNLI